MRSLRAAGRAADDVSRANLPRLVAVAKRACAANDEEHLLLGSVAVKRTGALAGRNHVIRIAEILCAEKRSDAHRIALEVFPFLEVLELQLVDVDYPLFDHRSISPKTMSCVPMIATTSAIMCPRDISSSAERCAKPAARSLMRYGLLAPSEMM